MRFCSLTNGEHDGGDGVTHGWQVKGQSEVIKKSEGKGLKEILIKEK